MVILKKLFNQITIKMCGYKIIFLFNSILFNVNTYGAGVSFIGTNCVR
jgi:hypothetical protein